MVFSIWLNNQFIMIVTVAVVLFFGFFSLVRIQIVISFLIYSELFQCIVWIQRCIHLCSNFHEILIIIMIIGKMQFFYKNLENIFLKATISFFFYFLVDVLMISVLKLSIKWKLLIVNFKDIQHIGVRINRMIQELRWNYSI